MINKQMQDSQAFYDLYAKHNIDCIVMPGFAVPAVKHGHSQKLGYTCLYTFLFNVLDMPVAAIPVTLVRKDEETFEDPANSRDQMVRFAKETSLDSQGCPVGIQVVCLPYEDEKLCGIARQMEKAMAFDLLPLSRVNSYKL